jgi:SAM-dependent methyltransferase
MQTPVIWPKIVMELSEEQLEIKDDFMRYWHEVLPRKYGIFERFNHSFIAKQHRQTGETITTLEIGAGLGEHTRYENLTTQHYHALELRKNMADVIRERYPDIITQVGDIQKKLDFPDGVFDRVIAIHVLEHLPDLPNALKEVNRLMNHGGSFELVIPCEGSLAYSFARMISTRRLFEKRYKTSFDWFIKSEHINSPNEILHEISNYFKIMKKTYFPIPIPMKLCNLCIGIKAAKKHHV